LAILPTKESRIEHRPKIFLSRCVPNLQLQVNSIYRHCFSPKLNSYGEIMQALKFLVCELQHKATLSDPGISDNDVLEEKRITHLRRLMRENRDQLVGIKQTKTSDP
jgi:hypothetical protein